MSEPTEMIHAIQWGDPKAAQELFPLVYDELRRLAAGRMRNEPEGHAFRPTALVPEAWLQSLGDRSSPFARCAPFFRAATELRVSLAGARKDGTIKLPRRARATGSDQLESLRSDADHLSAIPPSHKKTQFL